MPKNFNLQLFIKLYKILHNFNNFINYLILFLVFYIKIKIFLGTIKNFTFRYSKLDILNVIFYNFNINDFIESGLNILEFFMISIINLIKNHFVFIFF